MPLLVSPLVLISWGEIAQPSAKQNNAFCFFFWKKKNLRPPIDKNNGVDFLGAMLPDPWVRFAKIRVAQSSAKQNNWKLYLPMWGLLHYD
jgi:hypothetical protein